VLSKISQAQKDKYYMIPLLCGTKILNLENQRVKWWVLIVRNEGNGRILVKGNKVSVMQS
jgi:hypothetical protein